MKNRVAALVMAALLALYIVLVAQRAVMLVATGVPVGIIMGIALMVLPLVAVWAIARELLFGARTEKLVRILDSEGNLPVEELPHRASGRPLRDAADEEFPKYKAEVEAEPQSWRAWFRLGLAYDASGDRRRARHALREAIRLYRSRSARTA
jgi:hypothetical protein